ncbi:hypothetical protein F4815DRAFT_475511 [Daldinia loculata]|nr:hypothetical protein F4815DRAFT_475511 [Daldinia loculata]
MHLVIPYVVLYVVLGKTKSRLWERSHTSHFAEKFSKRSLVPTSGYLLAPDKLAICKFLQWPSSRLFLQQFLANYDDLFSIQIAQKLLIA